MSKYTTELRYLLETGYPVGLTTYPIFEESYRETLNDKILEHYRFREIGFETAGLFVNRLNERMNLIMPYYNQLYSSALIKFDPLLNASMSEKNDTKKGEVTVATNAQKSTGTTDTNTNRTETISDTTTGTKTDKETGDNSENSTDTKSRKEVGSDTPQGLLSIGNIENEVYASTAALGSETDTHTGTSNHTIDTTETTDTKYDRTGTGDETSHGTTSQTTDANANTKNDGWQNLVKTLEGYQGVSASSLLQEFRSTFLNIDLMVISELESLFMCIY